MTPERIADLRRQLAIERESHAGLIERYPEAKGRVCYASVPADDLDALLAECERPWTSELPKESGWYWMQITSVSRPTVVLVDVDTVYSTSFPSGLPLIKHDGCRWFGPLTPPQQAGAQT